MMRLTLFVIFVFGLLIGVIVVYADNGSSPQAFFPMILRDHSEAVSTATPTLSPSATSTEIAMSTPSPTPTPTATATPSHIPTLTHTFSPTFTPTLTQSPTATPPATPRLWTAREVLDALIEAEIPVGESFEYDEETDPNDLLGRPGQYTGKINFRDTRLTIRQPDDYAVTDGGSIEVFANVEDRVNRANYLRSVCSSFPLLCEYDNEYGNVLLRLSFRLPPSQAAEYVAVVQAFVEGQPLPTATPTPATVTPTPTSSPSPTATPRPYVLSNHSSFLHPFFKDLYVYGEVYNPSSAFLTSVWVYAILRDNSGNLIDNASTYVGFDIPSGDMTCFRIRVDSPPAAWTTYEFDRPSYRISSRTGVPRLTVFNDHYDSAEKFVVGELRNDDVVTVDSIALVGTFYDAEGIVINCVGDYPNYTLLAPGESTFFKLKITDDIEKAVANYRLQADGREP